LCRRISSFWTLIFDVYNFYQTNFAPRAHIFNFQICSQIISFICKPFCQFKLIYVDDLCKAATTAATIVQSSAAAATAADSVNAQHDTLAATGSFNG